MPDLLNNEPGPEGGILVNLAATSTNLQSIQLHDLNVLSECWTKDGRITLQATLPHHEPDRTWTTE